jgi:hypothetical protein
VTTGRTEPILALYYERLAPRPITVRNRLDTGKGASTTNYPPACKATRYRTCTTSSVLERKDIVGALFGEVRVRDKTIVSATLANPTYAPLIASSEAHRLRLVTPEPEVVENGWAGAPGRTQAPL